jgi:hypothetical protein
VAIEAADVTFRPRRAAVQTHRTRATGDALHLLRRRPRPGLRLPGPDHGGEAEYYRVRHRSPAVEVPDRWDDTNGNGEFDYGEAFTDRNGNGRYDAGEPYTD